MYRVKREIGYAQRRVLTYTAEYVPVCMYVCVCVRVNSFDSVLKEK